MPTLRAPLFWSAMLVVIAGLASSACSDPELAGVASEPDAGEPACPEDEMNDCGGCGFACDEGGACREGECDIPTVLAVDNIGPWSLAIAEGTVYFTSYDRFAGVVAKVPAEGGDTTRLASGQTGPWSLAVAGDRVYWTNFDDTDGKVASVSVDGGDVEDLAVDQAGPRGIAVDGEDVYFTNLAGGTVMRVAQGDAEPTVVVSGQGQPQDLVLYEQMLYWTNDDDGTVMRASRDGDVVEALATGQEAPRGIAVDAGGVYWANANDGTVMWLPLDGGEPEVLASGVAPAAVALDEDYAYFTDSGDAMDNGTVMKVSRSGGEATPIAAGQGIPFGIAIDEDHVYWASTDSGAVMRAEK